MDRRAAKEILHLRDWLMRAQKYDEIDRELTWVTLARDLPAWRSALSDAIAAAERYLKN
jgi:uncharacterized protein with HEPN domain